MREARSINTWHARHVDPGLRRASDPASIRVGGGEWCGRLMGAALAGLLSTPVLAQSPFASRVLDYSPAPGQFVQNPQFNDPARALGAPVGGGTINPDTTKVVSLGGFGGAITLGFDHRVIDDPRNPLGLDAIVFGNASYVAGNPARRFAEGGTIEISLDANANGLADDPWFLIVPPYLALAPLSARTWDDNLADPTFPPQELGWVPPGRSGVWQTWAHELPAFPYAATVLQNPLGLSSPVEGVRAIADHTPTLILGDINGDNTIDQPQARADRFYTTPDDPFLVGITWGSGGGDAFDIAWAMNPATGQPANLPGFDFIRITTAIDLVHATLGEMSTEVAGVADVRPALGKAASIRPIVGTP